MPRNFTLSTLSFPNRFFAFVSIFVLTLYLFNGVTIRLSSVRWGHSANLQSTNEFFTPVQAESTMSFSLPSELSTIKKSVLERLSSSNAANENSPVLLIMGNEAGDTDSMASAILSSYLLSKSIEEGSGKYANLFPKSTLIAPLIQQQRRDLPLRAENQFLLSILGLEQDNLLFLDDLPNFETLAKQSNLLLGLVDHPRLSSAWQPYDLFEKRVEFVLDHHADDGAHKNAKIRILRGPENGAVGSAASVVVEAFKETDALTNLPAQLADLALAAILIDTDNLRPVPKGKATEVDLNAAHTLLQNSTFGSAQRSAFIQSAVQISGVQKPSSSLIQADMEGQGDLHISQSDQQATLQAATQYFEILSEKKLDVSRLNTHDLLRRDYKEMMEQLTTSPAFTVRAGFSSVPVGLSDWIHTRHGDGEDRWAGYWKSLQDWMKERKLDVAVVGTSFRELAETGTLEERKKNGKHRRELVLAYLEKPSTGQNLFPALVKELDNDSYAASLGNDESQLLELESPWKGSRRDLTTFKRERVGGLQKDGLCSTLNEADARIWIAVWRQRNARASRKIYLPAVMHSLKLASKSKVA